MASVKAAHNIFILDKKTYNQLYLIEEYTSFIWTNNYDSYGTFEIYMGLQNVDKFGNKDELLTHAVIGNYVWFGLEPNRLMMIERLEIKTSVEHGNMILISGRSLEAILLFRNQMTQVMLNGNLQDGLRKVVWDNCINGSVRGFPDLATIPNTATDITKLKMNTQYTGQKVYQIVQDNCKANKLGFDILFYPDGYPGSETPRKYKWVFRLYMGTDRSYDQMAYPQVVFSYKYENLLSTHYIKDLTNQVTNLYVAGEGEGSDRIGIGVGNKNVSSWSGIDRREDFIDARDISRKTDHGTMYIDDYKMLLAARGLEKFGDYKPLIESTSEIDPDTTFKYKEDYNLGDIVQVENSYGMLQKLRIDSVVWAHDTSNGFTVLPTFKSLDNKEE